MMFSLRRLCSLSVWLLAFIPSVAPQQPNEYFSGQNPLMESRIFGASANFRNEALEKSDGRYPLPFRLLVVGDDHAHGCGWKSFPPDYSYANCSSLDEGFRVRLLKQLRSATKLEIVAVGTKENPPVSPVVESWANKHEATPGARVDELQDHVPHWVSLTPDVLVISAGTTDLLQYASGYVVAQRYEALLEAVRLALPRCRVFVVTPLNMGDVAAPAGIRHHLMLLQKLLPPMIVAFKAKNMQVDLVDVSAPDSPVTDLCKAGSGVAVGGLVNVPQCTQGELNPTNRGYLRLAAALVPHLQKRAFEIDGSCRGRPLCQDAEVKKWRNQIDGGLRVW